MKVTVCIGISPESEGEDISTDVLGLSQRSVGDHELGQQRQRIQHLAEETNAQLKRNVYMNYMQFIDTAKEISCKSCQSCY